MWFGSLIGFGREREARQEHLREKRYMWLS